MKKIWMFVVLSGFFVSRLNGQCNEISTERIMLLGDSWSALMNTDSTYSSVFDFWGHSNKSYFTNSVLSQSGAVTLDFLTPVKLTEIQSQLLAHPTIDHVLISLGGNDVLNQWNTSWTQNHTDSLLDAVTFRLNLLIDYIKLVKPDIRLVWSGYTYPNFGEIIGDLAPFQSSHPFYNAWNSMGQPTFSELNNILNYYSAFMETFVLTIPNLEFVNATGLLQYTYGQTANLTVPPGGSYPAFTATLPLGFPDYPSPKSAMRNYIIFKDCFHLSPQGYFDFVSYQTQKYYHKALMNDQQILSEGSNTDGAVSNTGTITPQLMLGASLGEDYACLISFNTTLIPDTGITAASLYLRREMVSGTNPLAGQIQVEIINGFFGTSNQLETLDFNATGNAVGSPCLFGTTDKDGGWIRIDLPVSFLQYINNSNSAQFKLSAPGSSGIVEFTDATDSDFAPVLDLTFGITSGLEDSNPWSEVSLYPNPASSIIYFRGIELTGSKIEIWDISGRRIRESYLLNNYYDMTSLPEGVYIFKLFNNNKNSINYKVVKY